MKEQILALRAEGKSYREIEKILGCSRSTIAYHCGKGIKAKQAKRQRNRRKEFPVLQRTETFQRENTFVGSIKGNHKLRSGAYEFALSVETENIVAPFFRWQDVIEKFGWDTHCYLTGTPIDLKESKAYQFDHIVPTSRGGNNSIENLGILRKDVNQAKSDKTVDEFLELCKEVLEFNGYEVTKKDDVA